MAELADLTTQELVAALAAIPERVEALTRQARPSGGDGNATDAEMWTPSELVGHLCDAARYWGARMRRVVHEEQPAMDMFDENALVRLAAYRYWSLPTLLRNFRSLSEENVAFLRGLDASDWERAGTHPERGALTLREIVEIEVGHEQGHVRQLAETLGVLEA